jgi:signal peptidase I
MNNILSAILKRLRSILYYCFILFIAIIVALIVKVFLIEVYKIPSGSMEPTLLTGDYIIVQKVSYGARLLRFKKLFSEHKQDYIRIKGLSNIKKNDVLVFNFPDYNSLISSYPNIFGNFDLVKRCAGIPGDSVLIKDNKSGPSVPMQDLFPYDSSFNWQINNYGPLYVPKKGIEIDLNLRNIKLYKAILKYEDTTLLFTDSCVFKNNLPVLTYTFLQNYYFMKGDNFYYSQDSRFWGFVPECNIIGKASVILCSFEQDNIWYNSFRWSRIFKIIR